LYSSGTHFSLFKELNTIKIGVNMRKLNTFSIITIFFLLIYSVTFAQSGAGKLAGKITDAVTGEPLIGANVVLVNTSQGAAADINGEYCCRNHCPVRAADHGTKPKPVLAEY